MTGLTRGLCPSDPRIYRIPASPIWRRQMTRGRLAAPDRVWPRNRRSGRIPALPYPRPVLNSVSGNRMLSRKPLRQGAEMS